MKTHQTDDALEYKDYRMIEPMHPTRVAPPPRRYAAGRATLLLALGALTLAGCEKLGLGGGDSAPTGQVVATLDGQEITVLEVNAELQGTPIPPSMNRRDAEKLALENIVTRRMLAKEAETRELDKKPDFLLQERRAAEQLRVQALARDVAAKVVTPSRDEADKFIAENPALFRDRKFFIMDQIQFLRPANINKLGFETAKTMEAVEAILKGANIEFRRQPASMDTLGANPEFVKEVTRVLDANPQEIFMFASRPQGAPAPVVLVNQVRETRLQPFTGDKAREYATNYLKNERIQAALRGEVEKAKKTQKERVAFQKGWEPPVKKPGTPAGSALKAGPAGAELPGGNPPEADGLVPAAPAPQAAAPAPSPAA